MTDWPTDISAADSTLTRRLADIWVTGCLASWVAAAVTDAAVAAAVMAASLLLPAGAFGMIRTAVTLMLPPARSNLRKQLGSEQLSVARSLALRSSRSDSVKELSSPDMVRASSTTVEGVATTVSP
jgi:hypothetical protein